MKHLARLRRHVGAHLVGERPIPVGRTARDRRLLRRVLRGRPVGRVLVVGPGLAVRQALPGAAVDVAGTSPHAVEVTVCSAVDEPGSLPIGRWDTVVVSDPGENWPERLGAVLPSCRPAARLLVVDCAGWTRTSGEVEALATAATVRGALGRHRHKVWVAEAPS